MAAQNLQLFLKNSRKYDRSDECHTFCIIIINIINPSKNFLLIVFPLWTGITESVLILFPIFSFLGCTNFHNNNTVWFNRIEWIELGQHILFTQQQFYNTFSLPVSVCSLGIFSTWFITAEDRLIHLSLLLNTMWQGQRERDREFSHWNAINICVERLWPRNFRSVDCAYRICVFTSRANRYNLEFHSSYFLGLSMLKIIKSNG